MKRFLAPTLAALALAACSDAPPSPVAPAAPQQMTAPVAPYYAKGSSGVEGDYIVVFKASVSDPLGKADEKLARHGGKLKFKYESAIKGYAATLSADALAALQADPDVAYIEQDQIVTANTTQTSVPSWGIDRIDQRALPLNGSYVYTSTGTGVRAYIIDTGIQTSHPEFGGRASAVYDAIGDGQNGQDCNGHGTHVAGTVGSASYGVAKNAYLRAVRVLNCAGSGTASQVLAGMNWVTTNHISPSVANMSLGGGFSQAENDAASNMSASGVFLAVAAGNSNADACNSSPSSAPGTVTVAASERTDARATYSNYGGCVDLYAPGSAITSTWLNGGTNTISGTSMATPHVTGVAALYKATYGNAAWSTIRDWLSANATANVITGNSSATPNKLLYKSTL